MASLTSHAGSIVHHAFADGHVIGLTDAVDPATYLGLTTRNGSEVLDDSLLR